MNGVVKGRLFERGLLRSGSPSTKLQTTFTVTVVGRSRYGVGRKSKTMHKWKCSISQLQ